MVTKMIAQRIDVPVHTQNRLGINSGNVTPANKLDFL